MEKAGRVRCVRKREHLHLVLDANEELFGSNPYVSPTVGGTHPSDLGHREIANYYAAYLPPLLDN